MLYRRLILVLLAVPATLPPALSAETTLTWREPQGELTLAQALGLALAHNPGLATFAWDIRAAEARALQAGLRPNPELMLDTEDLTVGRREAEADTRTLSLSATDGFGLAYAESTPSTRGGVFGEAEITLSLSQLVELGGKRAKRIAAAHHERDVAAWDYEVSRADVLAATAQAFYEVIVAQERLALAQRHLALARESHEVTRTLTDVGRTSSLDLTQSQLQLDASDIEHTAAAHALDAARIALAGQWGSSAPEFTHAAGVSPTPGPLPTLEEINARIDASPYLQRWQAEIELRAAERDRERAYAAPDMTVTFGVRRTRMAGMTERGWEASTVDGLFRMESERDSGGTTGLVLGVAIPLPLFNRNQGAIREAEHLHAKASDERRAAENTLTNTVAVALRRAAAASDTDRSLGASVLPHAQAALDTTRAGYEAGEFGLLNILLAQRAVFAAELQRIEARAAFLAALVEIERITGMAVAPEVPAGAAAP